VIDQRQELTDYFSAKPLIPREGFAKYQKLLSSSLAKVIIGPRRAGKSVLAYQLLQGKEFAYLNFDDENLVALKPEAYSRSQRLNGHL
jgi:hypothetical protein